jgi:sugar phosphate isomerase/epimerase
VKIKYVCPFWGCENDTVEIFIEKVLSSGYEGIEINLPEKGNFTNDFIAKIEDIINERQDFNFIVQQLIAPQNETVGNYINKMNKNLVKLAACRPFFINSHTGSDHYSFDDNCKVIDAALNVSNKTGVRILHETHRGRFSFHAASLLPYLKKFPELELVGDFSHFCTVSESLLQGQEEILQQIIPHIAHIHARIGHEQGPQVNDPFAPEWHDHLTCFKNWWQQIIDVKNREGFSSITITPEFGPPPYMPVIPFTKQPIGNQWQININIMNYLKKNIAV